MYDITRKRICTLRKEEKEEEEAACSYKVARCHKHQQEAQLLLERVDRNAYNGRPVSAGLPVAERKRFRRVTPITYDVLTLRAISIAKVSTRIR